MLDQALEEHDVRKIIRVVQIVCSAELGVVQRQQVVVFRTAASQYQPDLLVDVVARRTQRRLDCLADDTCTALQIMACITLISDMPDELC